MWDPHAEVQMQLMYAITLAYHKLLVSTECKASSTKIYLTHKCKMLRDYQQVILKRSKRWLRLSERSVSDVMLTEHMSRSRPGQWTRRLDMWSSSSMPLSGIDGWVYSPWSGITDLNLSFLQWRMICHFYRPRPFAGISTEDVRWRFMTAASSVQSTFSGSTELILCLHTMKILRPVSLSLMFRAPLGDSPTPTLHSRWLMRFTWWSVR